MKKSLSILLAISMLFIFSAVFPAVALEKVTIVFEEPWGLKTERGIVINSIIEDFKQAHPNIDVQIRDTVPAKEKLLTEIIAGTAGDVVMIAEDLLPEFAKQEAFVDLTPYIEKWDPAKKDDFYTAPFILGQYADKSYAIPWIAHSMCLIYNRDMFKAAGLDPDKPPTTWDELYDYAKKLTIPDKQYGFGLVGKQSHDMAWYWYIFLHQAGGEKIKKVDNRWQVTLNSKEGLEAL